MKNLVKKMQNAAHKFSIWDFALLKITLVSLGIILGSYFSQFFQPRIFIIWIIFVVTYVLTMISLFKNMESK